MNKRGQELFSGCIFPLFDIFFFLQAKKMYPDESTRSSTPDVSENSAEVEGITSNPNALQENSFVRQNKVRQINDQLSCAASLNHL